MQYPRRALRKLSERHGILDAPLEAGHDGQSRFQCFAIMLYTRKLVDHALAETAVGGITIYGETQDEIVSAVIAATNHIERLLTDQLCMNKRGIRGKVCADIPAEHPERVFSALFGRAISEGKI